MAFEVKDSGKREEFASGMVRDTQSGKLEYDRMFDGPMADRWATLLTKAANEKYLDSADGTPNWMLADSPAELKRARKSVVRHLRQWLRGDVDEDHAAAVMFNLNLAEYVKLRIAEKSKTQKLVGVYRGKKSSEMDYYELTKAVRDMSRGVEGLPTLTPVPSREELNQRFEELCELRDVLRNRAPNPILYLCPCGRNVRERDGAYVNDNNGKLHTCGRE